MFIGSNSSSIFYSHVRKIMIVYNIFQCVLGCNYNKTQKDKEMYVYRVCGFDRKKLPVQSTTTSVPSQHFCNLVLSRQSLDFEVKL
jgi:hypothetical protein